MQGTKPKVLSVVATVALGLLGMIAGHCGVYQLSALLVEVESTAHAHHVSHLSGGAHHVGAAADPMVASGHGHLIPMASGAFLVFVVAALLAVVAVQRRIVVRVALPALIATQLASFAVLEVVMRLTAEGPITSLADSALWLALAVQFPVAVLVSRLCRRLAEMAERWFAGAVPSVVRGAAIVGVHPVAPPVCARLHDSLTFAPRGPPVGTVSSHIW